MGEETKKQVRVKIVHKHETAANWESSNYIPDIGEVVFYDPDSTHNYTRQKNGDGVRTVKNLPFTDTNSNTTYDLSVSKNSTNGNATLNLTPSSGVTDSITIKGSGATEVTTDANGVINIHSSSNSAAGTSLGLVKTGGDVTISSGVITVNDNSHNHTIDNVTGLQSSLDEKADKVHAHDYIPLVQKGAANGVAELDGNGKVPTSQLPSYVDDIIEGYYNVNDNSFYKESYYDTLIANEAGKIYVDLNTNKTYRWGGDISKFVLISETLAIGTTTGTALDGKIGSDHIANTENPHQVNKTQVGLGSVQDSGDSDVPQADGKEKFTTGGAYTLQQELTSKITDEESARKQAIQEVYEAIGSGVFEETDPTVPEWAKADTKPSYNLTEISEAGDYVHMTKSERTKLSSVATGAEVNVQSDWNATSGDAFIKNKPTLATVATSGSYTDLTNKPTVDSALSDSSTNAIQNKIVNAALKNKVGITTYNDNNTIINNEINTVKQDIQELEAYVDEQIGEEKSSRESADQTLLNSLNEQAERVSNQIEGIYESIEDLSNSIPTDTGATSITTSGNGNAVTTATYDSSTRKITLTKGLTFSQSGHTHAEYVNQNAFSKVKVGETVIAADSIEDTFGITGQNVTLIPYASDDGVTISVTKGNIANALGGTPILQNEPTAVLGALKISGCCGEAYGIEIATGGTLTVGGTNVITSIANTQNALSNIEASRGVANGLATLGSDGKVPSAQLPSYVDDVLEYTKKSSFPTTGETGKIYIDLATNKTYRWSGSTYVSIASDLALGETSSTAYYGDKGKIAYEHSQKTSDNPHKVTKTDVGLGNVANERQYSANNPPPYPVTSVAGKTGVVTLAKGDVGLSNVANTGDSATPVSGGTTKFTTGGAYTELNKKVDKVTGKGLSTNDYTTTEKNKLAGIAENANNYSHPTHTAKSSGFYKVTINGWGHVTGTSAVTKADITNLGVPAQDTTYATVTTSSAGLAPTLPTADATTKFLRGDGTWQKINPSFDTIYTNTIAPKDGAEIYLSGDLRFDCGDCGQESTLTEMHELASEAAGVVSRLASVATSGNYNDLTNKPTIPTVNNATLTIQRNGTTVKTFTANSATNVTANITVPTTASDVGAVPTSRKVNGKALSTDITIDIPDALADLSGDATHRTVTDTEKATWNAKSNFSGSYTDLTNKPAIPESISDLENDSSFIENWADAYLNSLYVSESIEVDAGGTLTVDGLDIVGAIVDLQSRSAFDKVKVGSTTIAADYAADTLELVGSNVTLTPDATNDKVTIGITKANVVSALGYTPPTSNTNTTYTLSKSNSTITLTGSDGSTSQVTNIASLGSSGTVPTSQLPTASGTSAGITVVYPAASCTTFSSDSGTVTPAAVQKGAKMFAITRPSSTTNKAIVRYSGTTGDVQNSKIIIEDVTNSKDSSKKAQVLTIPAEGGKKMVYGYCTDQVDGTSFIGGVFDASATSYPYNQGLAIGGTSGNLLWKGAKVATVNDLSGYLINGGDASFGTLEITGDLIVDGGANLELSQGASLIVEGVNVGNNLVNKIGSIDTWADDFCADIDTSNGISWTEQFSIYEGQSLDGEHLAQGPIMHRIPIIAGDNVTFEIDDQAGTVSINATGGSSSAPTNVSLGQGYGICSVAAATTAKTSAITGYKLAAGGIAVIRFTYAVPANATLNINSTGAKPIWFKNVKIVANVIKAGDTVTFMYDGTCYRVISIDRWQTDISSLQSRMTSLESRVTTIEEAVGCST